MLNSEQWLDTVANNLANASTTGFKRDIMTFREAMDVQLSASGASGQPLGSIGTGPITAETTGTLNELGPMVPTNNPLDAALSNGNQMFAVQTPAGVRYTRDGAFTLNQEGMLVTQQGDKVLDTSGNPIQLPTGKPNISSAGVVSVADASGIRNVGTLGVYSGAFEHAGNNLYTGANPTAVQDPQIAPGTLEGSNVNAVEAMVDLIRINRSYELQQKTISQQDQLTQKLTQSIG